MRLTCVLPVFLLSLMLYCSEGTKLILESDDGNIPEDIDLNPASNTFLVTVGEVKKLDHFVSTTNLHDLNTGWTAMRSANSEMCLLKPAGTAVKDLQNRLEIHQLDSKDLFVQAARKYWKLMPDILTHEQVEDLAGEKIADFCEDFETYLLAEKEEDTKQEGRKYRRWWWRRRSRGCSNCSNCCNGFTTADVGGLDEIDTEYMKR